MPVQVKDGTATLNGAAVRADTSLSDTTPDHVLILRPETLPDPGSKIGLGWLVQDTVIVPKDNQ